MSLDHLKSIYCPAGDRCTAFQCLFSHTRDVPSITSQAQPITGSSPVLPSDEAPPSNQYIPRKRTRTSLSPSSRAVESAVRTGSPSLQANSSSPHPKPSPVTQPGYSPARKRPRQTQEQGEAPKPNTCPAPNPSSTPNTPNKTPTSSGTAAAPRSHAHQHQAGTPENLSSTSSSVSKKPETLNPRLVKGAPASHEVRYKLLKMVHHEFARLDAELRKRARQEDACLLLSERQIIVKALVEEEQAARDKPAIYSNVLKNKIVYYRRMSIDDWAKERRADLEKAGPKKVTEPALPRQPKVITSELTTGQEVSLLRRLLTPITELSQYGYVASIPKDEDIRRAREAEETLQGWEKCDRCTKRFQVFPGRREEDGALTSGGECRHHPGRTFVPEKAEGNGGRAQKRYNCCGEAVGDSVGCTTGRTHVFKNSDPRRLASILNFVETPPNPNVPSDRAVCFDCEMGFTTLGLELIRLTATAWPTGDELIDVLVKPQGEILDLNSRYSGVWPNDIVSAQPWSGMKPPRPTQDAKNLSPEKEASRPQLEIVQSPAAARDLLFSILAPETPLIGHGLENDLNTTRIIHPTLVDTVLLYPHRLGLPYRLGLKMLTEKLLNRNIQHDQGSNSKGHDSAEDARASGDLARLRVIDEWKALKLKGWTVRGTEFFPPPDSNL